MYLFQLNMNTFGVFSLLFGLVYGTDDILQLSQGKIRGSILNSRNGREFTAFQGIPYAKPPVRDLRFEASHTYLLRIWYTIQIEIYFNGCNVEEKKF